MHCELSLPKVRQPARRALVGPTGVSASSGGAFTCRIRGAGCPLHSWSNWLRPPLPLNHQNDDFAGTSVGNKMPEAEEPTQRAEPEWVTQFRRVASLIQDIRLIPYDGFDLLVFLNDSRIEVFGKNVILIFF